MMSGSFASARISISDAGRFSSASKRKKKIPAGLNAKRRSLF